MIRPPILTVLLFLLIGCNSMGPEPSPTRPIAALVNGRIWAGGAGRGDTVADLAATPRAFEIAGTDSSSEVTVLRIVIHELNGTGDYTIGGFTDAAYATFAVLDSTGGVERYYQSGADHLGIIKISTLDTLGHFVSGSFAFEAHDGSPTAIVVSKGRFLAHYIPL
jgi:hypothetical protein